MILSMLVAAGGLSVASITSVPAPSGAGLIFVNFTGDPYVALQIVEYGPQNESADVLSVSSRGGSFKKYGALPEQMHAVGVDRVGRPVVVSQRHAFMMNPNGSLIHFTFLDNLLPVSTQYVDEVLYDYDWEESAISGLGAYEFSARMKRPDMWCLSSTSDLVTAMSNVYGDDSRIVGQILRTYSTASGEMVREVSLSTPNGQRIFAGKSSGDLSMVAIDGEYSVFLAKLPDVARYPVLQYDSEPRQTTDVAIVVCSNRTGIARLLAFTAWKPSLSPGAELGESGAYSHSQIGYNDETKTIYLLDGGFIHKITLEGAQADLG